MIIDRYERAGNSGYPNGRWWKVKGNEILFSDHLLMNTNKYHYMHIVSGFKILYFAINQVMSTVV